MNERSQMTPDRPPGFWEELRRRKVVRVAVAYVIVCWLIIQVAETLAPILQVPEWSVRLVFFLLLLGFPVALILAWAFELTPQGIKTTRQARQDCGTSQDQASLQRRRNRLAWGVGGMLPALLLGLSVGAGLVWSLFRTAAEPPAPALAADAQPTVAVLPFRNMSTAEENAYFADGVHEEILTELSRLKSLRVISRTSVMKFGSGERRIPEIADVLGATHVVEGSVRRDGDTVRVTAQLIDAGSDQHLWAENYDRQLAGIFEIQSQVAASIAAALETELSAEEAARLEPSAPRNPEAHEYYTRARLLNARAYFLDQERRDEAIALARRAVALEPDYAEAWQLLAMLETDRAYNADLGWDPDGTARERAEQALEQARALAPGASDTLLAESLFLWRLEQAFDKAHEVVARARQMEPQRADLMHVESGLLVALGRWDESLELAERAVALDPLNQDANNTLGYRLIMAERYSEAYEAFVRAEAASEPNKWVAFETQVARVLLDPSYGEWRQVMEAQLARLGTEDIPLVEPMANPVSPQHYLVHYLLDEGRLAQARELLGMPTEAINPDHYRDVWQLKNEIRALDFAGRDEEARARARELLRAVGRVVVNEDYEEALMVFRTWAAGYLGEDELAEEGLAYFRRRLTDADYVPWLESLKWYYCEAMVTVDPPAAPDCVLDKDLRYLTVSEFALRLDLWYPLLNDPRIQAWFADEPEWVSFMQAKWPETRPFPLDGPVARAGD